MTFAVLSHHRGHPADVSILDVRNFKIFNKPFMFVHTQKNREPQTFRRRDIGSKSLNMNRRDVTHIFKSRLLNKNHINSNLKSTLIVLTNEKVNNGSRGHSQKHLRFERVHKHLKNNSILLISTD